MRSIHNWKKTISTQKDKSSRDFKDLKEVITKQHEEISKEVNNRIESNKRDMNLIMEENKILRQQYSELAEHLLHFYFIYLAVIVRFLLFW